LVEFLLKKISVAKQKEYFSSEVRFRLLANNIFTVVISIFALSAIIPLTLIFFHMVKYGASSLTMDFFTNLPVAGESGAVEGGILNAISGFFIILLLTTSISTIPGVFIGLFIYENRSKPVAKVIDSSIGVISSLPSILPGIIIYLWVIRPTSSYSAFAGSLALSIIMMPIIAKTSLESFKCVPSNIIESATALGASQSKIAYRLLLPYSAGGIINGILLGVARVAGETAPLLLTVFGSRFLRFNPMMPMDSLPLTIYSYSTGPYPSEHSRAWGASIILVVFILFLSLSARSIEKKWKKKY
jgi:phosphate transport system permease protein